VHIGSQADPAFLQSVAERHGPFDIIIDDGSHQMAHQILTFETLYNWVHEDGLYICEDSFTSYWSEYGGGLQSSSTFMEYAKQRIDELHAFWSGEDGPTVSSFTRCTRGIFFYSGTVVFQRGPAPEPVYCARGAGGENRLSIAELKSHVANSSQE
jgi:hypothetical protein